MHFLANERGLKIKKLIYRLTFKGIGREGGGQVHFSVYTLLLLPCCYISNWEEFSTFQHEIPKHFPCGALFEFHCSLASKSDCLSPLDGFCGTSCLRLSDLLKQLKNWFSYDLTTDTEYALDRLVLWWLGAILWIGNGVKWRIWNMNVDLMHYQSHPFKQFL